MMRFVSFNINGIRAHTHQLNAIVTQLQPDVIGLQETKVHDDSFPIEIGLQHGYYVYYYGQKKYHGVALLLRQPPLSIIRGFTHDNYSSQKRIIIANINTTIGILTIINVYFPQGENKKSEKFTVKTKFYQDLKNHIQHSYNTKSLLLIMGDMNISPTDLDIGIGEKNQKLWIKSGKCSFLPEERQWINHLTHWGLIDIYRKHHPYNNKRYSWFSYQSKGFIKNNGLRIDLILVTQKLAKYYKYSDICYNIRSMQRPSDHAPVWVDFNI